MLFFRPLCFVALGLGLASALESEHPHKYDGIDEKMSPEETFYKPSLTPYLGHGGLDHGIGGAILDHGSGLGQLGHGVATPLYGGIADHSGVVSGIGHSPAYDDFHKYGGIGKKSKMSQLYDHGSKGEFSPSFFLCSRNPFFGEIFSLFSLFSRLFYHSQIGVLHLFLGTFLISRFL